MLIGSLRGLYKDSFGGVGAVYRNNQTGDHLFLALIAVVLSRHILYRICCTWDPSTHFYPTFRGILSHILQTSILTSGKQCFDRPLSPHQVLLIRQVDTQLQGTATTTAIAAAGAAGSSPSSSSNHGITPSNAATKKLSDSDHMVQMMNSCGVLFLDRSKSTTRAATITVFDLLPSWVLYTVQIPRFYILYPITRWIGTPLRNSNSNFNTSSRTTNDEKNENRNSNHHHHSHRTRHHNAGSHSSKEASFISRFTKYCKRLVQNNSIQFWWIRYSSHVQIEIFIWIILYPVVWVYYNIVFMSVDDIVDRSTTPETSFFSWSRLFPDYYRSVDSNRIRNIQSRVTNILINTLDYKQMQHVAEKEKAQMIGTYIQPIQPTVVHVLWILLGFGIIWNMAVFFKISFPLPDLISASSSSTSASAGRSNTDGARIGNRRGNHRNVTNNDRGWFRDFVERNTSPLYTKIENFSNTMANNRLTVSFFVILGRVLENIIVVGIMPRTHFACRVMGHCASGLSSSEISRILYPGGLISPRRTDGPDSMTLMENDPFSAIWSLLAIFTTSTILLLSQTLILNRSFIANSVHHSIEWEVVSKESKKSLRQADDDTDLPWLSSSQHQSATDIWDSRRKYVKGEIVYYPDWFGGLYRARVNAPEGHPTSNGFRILDEELSLELGHPATSRTVTYLAVIQLILAVCYFCMWTALVVLGFSQHSYGLIWTVVSLLLAVHGVVSTAMKCSPYSIYANDGLDKQQSASMRSLHKLNSEIMKHNC